jgi:peptidylprolyl isomerase
MKRYVLTMFLAAGAAAAFAQSTPKAATAPKPATTANKAAATTTNKAAATTFGIKLPPGVPPARGVVKTAPFVLRYQDIKIGTGADAEPNKMYKVLYTGWIAADGRKFDSSDDHRLPLRDKDGKPVLGDDGKPKLGDPQPLNFPQGFGRVIPGFDQGFDGMKIGGKRRLFIPWQLAYGAHGRPGPDAEHPGIPAKADLIFDIELVDVSDMQMPQGHPGMPPGAPVRPGMPLPPGHAPAAPGTQPPPPNPGQPSAPGAPATPPTAAQPAAPAQPATPAQSQPKQ